MTEQLYTAAGIAEMLGTHRHWVLKSKGPEPDFQARFHGANPVMLWTERSVERWRAYHASPQSIPGGGRYTSYSDHRAVNQMGPTTVTWKLWWRPTFDGGTQCWFSTPVGWYVSEDDGENWRHTGAMDRPSDFTYVAINGNGTPTSWITIVLHRASKIRQRLEAAT